MLKSGNCVSWKWKKCLIVGVLYVFCFEWCIIDYKVLWMGGEDNFIFRFFFSFWFMEVVNNIFL